MMKLLIHLPERVYIRKLERDEVPPLELLLPGCPSVRMIRQNIDHGVCYLAILKDTILGAFVLIARSAEVFEIAHFATSGRQRRELGQMLLERAIEKAKALAAEILEIGVSTANFHLLELLQKCGFRIYRIEPDYYSSHFARVPIENGIRCRDRLILRLSLT